MGKLYSRVILGRIAVATRIGDLTKIITQALCDAEDKSEEILTIRLSAQKGKYVGLNPVEFCTAVAATYPWERTNKNVVIRFLVQKPPEEQYLLQALAKSTYAYMNPENPEDKQRGPDEESKEEVVPNSLPPPRYKRARTTPPRQPKTPAWNQMITPTRETESEAQAQPSPKPPSQGRTPDRPPLVRLEVVEYLSQMDTESIPITDLCTSDEGIQVSLVGDALLNTLNTGKVEATETEVGQGIEVVLETPIVTTEVVTQMKRYVTPVVDGEVVKNEVSPPSASTLKTTRKQLIPLWEKRRKFLEVVTQNGHKGTLGFRMSAIPENWKKIVYIKLGMEQTIPWLNAEWENHHVQEMLEKSELVYSFDKSWDGERNLERTDVRPARVRVYRIRTSGVLWAAVQADMTPPILSPMGGSRVGTQLGVHWETPIVCREFLEVGGIDALSRKNMYL